MEDIKVISKKVMEAFEREGINKANFTVIEKETQEFNVENGEFSLFRTLFDKNLSITVYKDQKKGQISTNRMDEAAIDGAVKGALNSAESGIADEAYDIAAKQENEVFHQGVYEPELERLFDRAQEFLQDIKERHPLVSVMLMVVSHEKCHKIYQNTNGTEYEVFGGAYNIMLEFSGNDGKKTTSFIATTFKTADLDRPFIEVGTVDMQLACAEAQLNTIEFGEKFEGEIILTPECLGEFMYAICVNFLHDHVILDQTSIWLNKIGQKVADERISLAVNPSDDRIVEGECYTQDGFKSEDYELIKDGILQSFMTSLYISNKTGVERAKNSSFSLIMKGGEVPYADMVKQMKKGLIVGGFSGGQPSTNGEFSGVAKNSFLVEDGKIIGAVTETMINGNLAELINHVVAISKETVANGDYVLPYLAASGILISGK